MPIVPEPTPGVLEIDPAILWNPQTLIGHHLTPNTLMLAKYCKCMLVYQAISPSPPNDRSNVVFSAGIGTVNDVAALHRDMHTYLEGATMR